MLFILVFIFGVAKKIGDGGALRCGASACKKNRVYYRANC